ncbi:30S ribosomal protein S16 [Candidatus Wolfebacteria bacterium CG18_big_fil_WC_8_21_14_2_50_39_7]|uniref:Small ribosomal subunit protein bS16 n=1 Tax=Candidatus Wolfebacteria bacterium CG18_big_fil_WC_8_21_14_2_50_39_7 TaxID=1975071 RepID=A0A2H0ECM6_9BACT|nr:30S ribosomal protein S16 [Parcubacteria group bacterium]NCP58365.1 30S ribosomal protein S16 [Candidatus Wolfebacteria bacterium]PIP92193.1 MAG: 30S ribosomal protein S16 [Candidatus Wolfebacteria bacterium CG18_big_fil_WC_8_21_14_2_50_39_7]
MLTIKLKRIGKKNQASFRMIVAEKRSKLQGRYVEDLGWLNPKSDELNVKKERVEHWLKNGAQPTDTVHNLLVKIGLIKGPKRAVHAKSKKEVPVQSEPTGLTEGK